MRRFADQKTRKPEDHRAEEQRSRGDLPSSFPLCRPVPFQGKGRWALLLRSSAGYVLPIVLVITLALAISGTAFLTMHTGEIRKVRDRVNEGKAFYFAEAGIRKAIWRMNRRSLEEWGQWATFSEPNISVTYVDSTKTLTSVGNTEGKADTIRVRVVIDTPADHVVSYTGSFTEDGTSGELIGPEDNMPAQFQALPAVDLNYYRSIANYIYGREDSTVTQVFDSSLPDGIHFIYGDVQVKSGTTLNGTIVATGSIRFYGGSTISAQQVPADSPYYPAYYPAIISYGSSLSDITGGSQGLTINGMVYSSGQCDFNPCDVNGPIVAVDVELAGSYTVTYDKKYTYRPPGFSWPPGSFVAKVGLWSD